MRPVSGSGNMTDTLSWLELARRTYRESLDDDLLGQAAQLSYYLFLALFPALLFVLAVASFFPLAAATDDAARQLGPFVSPQVLQLIQDQMLRIGQQDSGDLVGLGIAGALWSSSAAMVAVTGALNRAYDLTEGRPWWKVRLTAIALTLSVAVFIVLAASLVLLGPASATWLGNAGFGPAAEISWRILQWPLSFALIAMGIGLVYYFAPDAEQDWVWITPGAIVATLLWLLASVAFRIYIVNFTDYTASYGAVGAVIVLLLWFYLSSVAVLIGAELNSEIEHAAPHAQQAPTNSKGRRLLGARAARVFEQRPADAAPPDIPAPAPRPQARSPILAAVIGAILLVVRRWRRP
jgi:membrane protein